MQTTIEKLDACKTRAELENLWTETYLKYRGDAWNVWHLFEAKRKTVIHAPQVFSETYKSYGWD